MTMTALPPENRLPEAKTAVSRHVRDRSRAIGSILVDLGRLTKSDVDAITRFAGERGLRFGDAAIMLELLAPDDIQHALARQYNFPVLPRGGPGGVADEVIAAYGPHADGVEALRALRTALTFSWLKDAQRNVLAVISPERGEGRSCLIANLATLFAQAGHRTLLMDANMRRPHQHTLFNLDNSVGLSALLTARAGREITQRIHENLRLYVMPAGIVPPNPQELLSRPTFEVVLDQCARQFDVVLIDTPAVSEAADAMIVSAQAASALMVTRRHHTRHAQLTSAMRKMTQSGVKVVGSVVVEH